MHGSGHVGIVFSYNSSLSVLAFISVLCLDILVDKMSLRISHTTLLCLFVISAWMCCYLYLSSICSHVCTSDELHIGHIFDG